MMNRQPEPKKYPNREEEINAKLGETFQRRDAQLTGPRDLSIIPPTVMNLLLEDLDARYQHGLQEYGTPLRPFNGRNSLQDAYEEVLDLALYLRQAIYEADNV